MNITKRKMKEYKRKIHEVPRLLFADAYTIGSNDFESEAAKEKSDYYMCARRFLSKINTSLYKEDDTRYILSGFGRIIDYCLFKPITMEEIYETDRFLANAMVTTKGLAKFNYPRELWIKIVENYNGRIPIQIKALPDGSVFYPHEPFAEIHNVPSGFGILAAWFESKTLQIWASTEMTTQIEHWLMYYGELLDQVYGDTMTDDAKDFTARLMLHNFGDRAGICPQESDWLGETVTLSVAGTDTFSGGYCAWKNSREQAGVALSVRALAHRNVQSYPTEFHCYEALYNTMANGDIASFVADLNDFYKAVKTTHGELEIVDPRCLLGLALRSVAENNGKIVVARPDSGIAIEQVLWLCRLAKQYGLFTETVINGKTWYSGTTLKFIEGDGMTWPEMREINAALIAEGFLPWAWGLYGVGGGLRNDIKRDNGSFKFALCAISLLNIGVVKFSDTVGKATLPGPFKLLRDAVALATGRTIVRFDEDGEDARQIYYDGTQEDFFGDVMFEDNIDCKARIKEQLAIMPKRLVNDVPASEVVLNKRLELLAIHAPEKVNTFF